MMDIMELRRGIFLLCSVWVGIALFCEGAYSLWNTDPALNTQITGAVNNQQNISMDTDGAGGAIVAWEDYRNATLYDIFAQKIDSSGKLLFNSKGVLVCHAQKDQVLPQIASDTIGGAIISWIDSRGTDKDIYAQRIDLNQAASWALDGAAMSAATGNQSEMQMIGDGLGGAFMVWKDDRGSASDIYAQRVDINGNPWWAKDGLPVCVATGTQSKPRLIADGYGGIIVVWEDGRNSATTSTDIYAQRLGAFGNPLWLVDGVLVCQATARQVTPALTSDNAGGAIIAWEDFRSSSSNIYAQKIDSNGQPLWTTDGVALVQAVDNQTLPEIATDSYGGAIVAWEDHRFSTTTDYDIFAQRVDAYGNVLWGQDGAVACVDYYKQHRPKVVSDRLGSAYVVWVDERKYIEGLYVQKMDHNGYPLFLVNGIQIEQMINDPANNAPIITDEHVAIEDGSGGLIASLTDWKGTYKGKNIFSLRVDSLGTILWSISVIDEVYDQAHSHIVSDGMGGAFITWEDYRYDKDSDIFAQKVDINGNLLWAWGDVAVNADLLSQKNPVVVGDGTGGAIIMWDGKAQKLDASGNPLWGASGVSAPSGKNLYRSVITDGAGGVFIAYSYLYDEKTNNYRTYLVHIDANGKTVQSLGFGDYTKDPNIVTDGTGGVLMTWESKGKTSGYDIFAQKFDSSLTPLWNKGGVGFDTTTGDQSYPVITSDYASGAYVTWLDHSFGSGSLIKKYMYVQRIDSTGTPLFGVDESVTVTNPKGDGYKDGLPTTWSTDKKYVPQIVPDGSGNAIMVWQEQKTDTALDILAQKVDTSGNTFWGYYAVPICKAEGNQIKHQVLSEQGGYATIIWEDWRSTTSDIYAQRIDSNGVSLWAPDGIPMCSAVDNQYAPRFTNDPSSLGLAIIAWHDNRSKIDYDIYAQASASIGLVPFPKYFLGSYFNDSGDWHILPPVTGYSTFISLTNAGSKTAYVSVTYRDILGGDRTPFPNTFTLQAGQSGTFRPCAINDLQEGGSGSPGARVPDMAYKATDDPSTTDIRENAAYGFVILSSDQPIVGRVSQYSPGGPQTAHALTLPSSSDYRLMAFFNDTAPAHTIPPASGHAAFVSIVNVSTSTANITVTYKDFLGGDRTPSSNTFTLNPVQGVTFRPTSVNDIQEGGSGSPGARVPDMPVSASDDPLTSDIRENAAWGYVLISSDQPIVGRVSQISPGGHSSAFAMAPVPSSNYVLSTFFNDSAGRDFLPPASGYASFISMINAGTTQTATISVAYKDFLGGNRTPSSNTFTLQAGQGVTFRPVSVNDLQEGGSGSPGAMVPDMPLSATDDPSTTDIKENAAYGFVTLSSDQPIVGRESQYSLGGSETAYALIPPSSTDYRLMAFFNDTAPAHALPPSSGHAAFISVINAGTATATITVTYKDFLGGDRTPTLNTFTLQAGQGVSFRPVSVSDVQEGGSGSPGARVPDMPLASMDDSNTTDIRENTAYGYVLFTSDQPIVGKVTHISKGGYTSSFALAPPK